LKFFNKETQPQQAVGYSLSVKNLRILEHTPKQNSLKRIFQSFGCLQMGTDENRGKLRGIKPIWSNKKNNKAILVYTELIAKEVYFLNFFDSNG
jgi:hypothetical protein